MFARCRAPTRARATRCSSTDRRDSSEQCIGDHERHRRPRSSATVVSGKRMRAVSCIALISPERWRRAAPPTPLRSRRPIGQFADDHREGLVQ
jgi:hypothetical protein